MPRIKSFATDQSLQAFVLAFVVLLVARMGGASWALAAGLGAIMVVFGLLLLLGRRSDLIATLARPAQDERSYRAHLFASAVAGNVIAVVIVVAFLVVLARGNLNPTPWTWLGAIFGVAYLVGIAWAVWRKS
jgi:uncharacterized membrane protein